MTLTADSSWRVAVVRDEGPDGSLGSALQRQGLTPVACPVLVEGPPADPGALDRAARMLQQYDWVVVASARSVRALARARGGAWPAGVRAAAVGSATAAALVEAGAERSALQAPAGEGADAIWSVLETMDWAGRRVLVPTTGGGRRLLADRLRAAGARVDEVEAYAMHPRDPRAIAADWTAAAPDAAVVGSARAADLLAAAIGAEPLRSLRAVVAIGPATAAALARHGVPCVVPPRADFTEAARLLRACRDGAAR